MKNIFLFILGCILITGGCRKAPPLVKCGCEIEDCIEIPSPQWGGFYSTTTVGTSYRFPCFNPNNKSELIYVEKLHQSGNIETTPTKLVKYNLISKEKTILIDEAVGINHIDWSRKGWIVFRDFWVGGIWKVKDDGTGVQKIYESPYRRPNFNYTGDTISITSHNHSLYPSLLLDLNGNVIDSSSGIPSEQKWNSKGDIPTSTNTSINGKWALAIYNIHTKKFKTIFTYDSKKTRIQNVVWHPDEKEIYYTSLAGKFRGGVFRCDLQGNIHQLKIGCNSRYYTNITASEDKILAERHDIKKVDDLKLEQKIVIVMMDLDGCNEEVILE